MPISDDDISEVASKPKSVTSHDGRQIVQPGLKEMAEAKLLLEDRAAADAAVASGGTGLRRHKIVPYYP